MFGLEVESGGGDFDGTTFRIAFALESLFEDLDEEREFGACFDEE